MDRNNQASCCSLFARAFCPRLCWLRVGALVWLAMAASGCAKPVRCRVSCFLSKDPALVEKLSGSRLIVTHRRYSSSLPDPFIFWLDAASELERQGYALMLERCFARAGRASSVVKADREIMLRFDYRISDLGEYQYSYPVYGWKSTGGTSYFEGYNEYGDYFSGTVDHAPVWGAVGVGTATAHRGYRHVLEVEAWDTPVSQGESGKVIWTGRCSAVLETADPQEAMPYLMIALAEYYGKATAKARKVILAANDKRVRELVGAVYPESSDDFDFAPAGRLWPTVRVSASGGS